MRKVSKFRGFLFFMVVVLLAGSLIATDKTTAPAKKPIGPWVKISVDFKAQKIDQVVGYFRKATGRNIIIKDGLNRMITAKINNMPAWQVFTAVLASHSLDLWQKGHIWIVTQLEADKPVIRNIRIRNTFVGNVFQRVNMLMGSGTASTGSSSSSSSSDSGYGSSDSSSSSSSSTSSSGKMVTIGQVKLLMDVNLNSIIVMGQKAAVDRIERVIDSLDIKIKDVLIRMKVVEIALTKGHQFGIDWSALGGDLSVKSTFGGNFSSSFGSVGFSRVFSGKVAGNRLTVSAMLKMLSTFNATKVLATPVLLVANGKKAKINLLTKIPYEESQANDEGKIIAKQYKEAEAGIKLEMQPQIFQNYVKLSLNPTIEFALAGLEYGKKPILDSTQVQTSLTVKDGETIIIGGLLYSKEVSVENKIPLLGDIPLLGALFSSKEKTKSKKEVAIFITVNIVDHNPSATRKAEWNRIKKKQWKHWEK